MSIENQLRAIRRAIHGKEVREAIASGIEACYGNTISAAQIAQIEAATAHIINDIESKGDTTLAGIPAEYTKLLESLAQTFDADTPYPIGRLVIGPDGYLYQFVTGHTPGNPWNTNEVTRTDAATILEHFEQVSSGVAGALEDYETELTTMTEELAGISTSNTTNSRDIRSLKQRIEALENADFFNVTYAEDGVAYFGTDFGGERRILANWTGIGGGGGSSSGGGGGSGNVYTNLTLENRTGWVSTTVTSTGSVHISMSWSSTLDGDPTGEGSLQVLVNNVSRSTRGIAQGAFTIDFGVKEYKLTTGTNTIKVRITDAYGNSTYRNFTITVEEIYITSPFEKAEFYSGTVSFPYVVYGELEKTVHFILDGTEIGQVVTSVSGRQLTYRIPQQTHGAHALRVYFTCEINGQNVPSNELYYEIIWAIYGDPRPIIACDFNLTEVDQYETITPYFTVYNPSSMLANVTVKINNTVLTEMTGLDRTTHYFQYRMDEYNQEGENTTFSLICGTTTLTKSIHVNRVNLDAVAETQDLALYLSSAGRSNSEEHPDTWVYTNGLDLICAQFTGFDFQSNGWVQGSDGFTALRINGGARLTIPYQIFGTDFRTTGKTIEIEFTVRDVSNYDAVIFSCFSGNRGFSMTPQFATLKAKLSELSAQFKDEDHIRLTFVINKRSGDHLIMVYINGIPSGVVQYSADNEDFSQSTPVGITVGHDDCTVDLYCIRVYDNDLTRKQVLDNWIADTQDGALMLNRYAMNNVFDAYGNIVIERLERLPTPIPYMIFECPELPKAKSDSEKKTITGSYVDPLHPERSFTFSGCVIGVQGTSSAPYYRKNWDVQFKQGFTNANNVHIDKYTLDPTVEPFNRFVLKADVASSEGANNVELVMLYCDLSPYKTREMLANPKVRQGIWGKPIVLFWRNTETGVISFYGKCNFNFPKRAAGPYGYHDDMESWEFQNNGSDLMVFKSDYFDPTMTYDAEANEWKEKWRFDYEARFPDSDWVDTTKLQEFQTFVYSTDRTAATGNALASSVVYDHVTYTHDTAAYRLAKFKNEFGYYAEIDSFVFYYIFTEFFLMVDSRAKNLFIGFSGSDTDPTKVQHIDRKAVCEPYDMDTAMGTNNVGRLMHRYNLEDTDQLPGGAKLYDGQAQESVLWNNVRDCFDSEIVTMYQSLRSSGRFTYDIVEKRFEDHQAVWPEAVWIEDSYFKYIVPLTNPDPGKNPDDAYLDMMQGSKLEQRRWWLSNRFKYMDSKWHCGDARSKVIQIRAYATANLTITPYSDLYVTVKYGSYTGKERASEGVAVTIPVPYDYTLGDTEMYVHSADQISDVGDLSPFKPGWAVFSDAVRITRIKVGDADANYENYNFNRLALNSDGHPLLKVVDCRNCKALGTAEQKFIDLSKCARLEEAYFDGTAITALLVPNGGVLKKLHLPLTVTDITIRNQMKITEFVCPDFSRVSSLWLENVSSAVNEQTILAQMAAGSRIRLIGFSWSFQTAQAMLDYFEMIDTMQGLDQNGTGTEKAQLYGTVYVPSITGAQVAYIRNKYPDVTYTYDTITSVITFMNGSSTFATQTVSNGGNATNPSGTPTKASDAQYNYTFAGWATYEGGPVDLDALKDIVADRTVWAVFGSEVRTYTVTFKNSNGTVLKTVTDVPYGGTATPPSDPAHPTDPSTYQFTGWNPTGANITGNTDCIAQYRDTSSPLLQYLAGTLTSYTSQSNTIGQYAFYQMSSLKTVDFAGSGNVSVGSNAFSSVTLNSITISSNTKASLASGAGLPQTLYADNGFIYVPANLIDSYKSDASWAEINFVAIGSTAGTDFSTISESWAQIKAAIDDESFFSSAYAIGDKKKLTYGTHNVYMEIRKIDTTNKFVDFVVKNFDESTAMGSAMAAYADTTAYSRLNTIYNNELPSDLKTAITMVAKKYYNYQGNTDEVTVPLWLLNTKDAGLTGSYLKDSEGENYFSTDAQRIKRQASNGSASYWWLGSANSSTSFMSVSFSGSGRYNNPASSYGLVFGFRIQKS